MKKSPLSRFGLVTTLVCLSAFASASEAKCYEPVENKASCSILNPSLCERKVEKVKLKNGMLVYLISDPGTKQSAAGICVEAGSWHDPKEYPGMAHFLEHMLFM